MTTVPSLTGKKLLSALKRAGFEVLRVKGSHHFVQHAGETLGPGLLAKILRDCDLTREQLQKLL